MSTGYNVKFSLLKTKKSNSLLCCAQPLTPGIDLRRPPHLVPISIWLLQSAVLLASGVAVALEPP